MNEYSQKLSCRLSQKSLYWLESMFLVIFSILCIKETEYEHIISFYEIFMIKNEKTNVLLNKNDLESFNKRNNRSELHKCFKTITTWEPVYSLNMMK